MKKERLILPGDLGPVKIDVNGKWLEIVQYYDRVSIDVAYLPQLIAYLQSLPHDPAQ